METLLYNVYTDKDGSIIYRNADGKLHRNEDHAVAWSNGSKFWYINGKLHRTNGPAVELSNGKKEWRIDGKLHRTDGPAIEWANGSKSFWINGEKLTEKEFLKRTAVQEFSMDEIADKLGVPVELLKIKK